MPTRLINHIFHTSHDRFLGNRRRCYGVNQSPSLISHIAVAADWHLAQAIDRAHHPTSLKIIQLMVFDLNFRGSGQEAFVHQDNFSGRIAVRTIFSTSKPVKTTRRRRSAAASKDLLDTRQELLAAATITRPSQSAIIFDFLASIALTSHLNTTVTWLRSSGAGQEHPRGQSQPMKSVA